MNYQTKTNLQLSTKNKYNLEERTALFGEKVIDLVKTLRLDPVNSRIISQVVASSGSIGANYCEANEAESKRDFAHKVGICKKEIKETRHWLRLLARANPESTGQLRILWQESQELLLIFSKIITTIRNGAKNEN